MSCLPPDYDFWRDSANIVVPSQPPVAIYTNTADEVVLRQVEDDEDVVVRVRPEHVMAICRAMLREIGRTLSDGAPQPVPAPEPVAKDRTGAERQRRYRASRRNGGRDVTPRNGDAPNLFREAAE
ncbi:hypothetical protein GCM10008179_17330 [Hansschlegelia plantiphila]|uniref:Uncharacterized protein n=1 Tax=Hansschlegelia plantiphila TaxID=374655 RepID=A0A9W6MVS7_9HYPH|nr:hypothetical protein GCM10008179_17330 [Hansschlegelia plantiphila]